jgi:hypothetical protein
MPRTRRATRNTHRDSPYAHHESNGVAQTSPYTPIDSENGEIRLIELHSGGFHDTIVMQLVASNLANDDHSYEALSYVWGQEVAATKAILNGTPITITSNLDCALRHLRLTLVKRTLWIDAVSTNQEDLHERGHQVQIMGDIYATAQGVIVWLGPVDQGNFHIRTVLERCNFTSQMLILPWPGFLITCAV